VRADHTVRPAGPGAGCAQAADRAIRTSIA
jgi:hypothetical protein